MLKGPFWSLSDPRRPKPNYLVDRAGPDWSFVIFNSETEAKCHTMLPGWAKLKPVKITSYEELLAILKLMRDFTPQLKWLHTMVGGTKPSKKRQIDRLPEPKPTRG